MSGSHERVWVVDRIEGEKVILVEDAAASDAATAEVGRSGIGVAVREGTVLRVPVSPSGALVWVDARADDGEEQVRREEGRRIQDELRGRDPGGDVKL